MNNLGAGDIDDGNKASARRQHRFARVHWAPICVKCREHRLVKPNSKYFGEFFDAKRTDRDGKASKKTLRIFSFLLIDAKQNVAVCYIQTLR